MNEKKKRKAAEDLSENVMWLIGQVLIKHNMAIMEASKEAIDAAVLAEREKVAKWMTQRSYATGHGDTTENLLAELEWQIAENWTQAMVKGVETEREECAKVVEEWITHPHLAAAIRARALHDMNQAAEDNGEPL